ncbi:MAG: hypothetical protein EBQ94_04205 [Flavobacteriales bacterium]|nr:hypothetical protein [Crocinitomicaceae bacterium]NBX79574.1 hypothetical protein [Flavobacteriales bacterium]
MPRIIQFLHPGLEPVPPSNSNIIPWNCTKAHKRKFLVSPGKYVSKGEEKEACLTFWGEWEPQSCVERLPNLVGNFPKYLNRPFLDTNEKCCQNTDPNVFGEFFQYMVCGQKKYQGLRNLEPNSLILFGSNKAGNFILDTLFVVPENGTAYNRETIETLNDKKKNAFYHASIHPLICENSCVEINCDLINDCYKHYKGITFRDKKSHHDIFSFVPSLKFNNENLEESMFERPIITLPGIISNGQRQGINGQGGRNYTTVEIVDTWNKIVKQVEDKGLLLATQFTEPPMISKEEVINNCKKLNC